MVEKVVLCVECFEEIEYNTHPPDRCLPCKKQHKTEYEKDWASKNRQSGRDAVARNQLKKRKIIDQIKLDRGCMDCGYNKYPFVLQFDHVRGQKQFTIGTSIGNRPLQALLDEIEKCDVVCGNCHAVRTWSATHYAGENSQKDSPLQSSEA